MTLRKMTVVRAPSTTNCPMVRIANRTLQLHGFVIGAALEVAYEQNIITLRILDHENTIQRPRSPVAIPAASVTSGETGAGKVVGHARRAEPCAIDTSQT